MDVTDEMIEQALNWLDGVAPTERIRKALSAALADVPEPGPVAVENFIKGKLESERANAAEARIAELEAQLAEVRAVLSRARKLTPAVSAFHDEIARALAGEDAKPAKTT